MSYTRLMFNINETIDAFRRGLLDIDCKQMVLTQHKEDGDRFEGPGYIRQSDDGTLIFKIYVTRHDAEPLDHLDRMLNRSPGLLSGEEMLYDLDATEFDGTRWTAKRILLEPHWNISDKTILAHGEMQSMITYLDLPQEKYHLRLHFFEEYDVPLELMTAVEKHKQSYMVRDSAAFEACGMSFEVYKREGSGDTVINVSSETILPEAFDLRVQEALQYITAKPAIWRARLEGKDGNVCYELASPQPYSKTTQFSPPIWPTSIDYYENAWNLFGKYLSYVTRETGGAYRNPVAYHLSTAFAATANSVNGWAAGISVAVEAVASIIDVEEGRQRADRLALFQERAKKWLDEQSDLSDFAVRMKGLINSLSKRRADDTLYALAENGFVETAYIKTWREMRNRFVHPKLKYLKKPDTINIQKLLNQIRCVETLLWQLTFYLIGYEGLFTDYGDLGKQNFPSKPYPLLKTQSLQAAEVPSTGLVISKDG